MVLYLTRKSINPKTLKSLIKEVTTNFKVTCHNIYSFTIVKHTEI